ncbi:MAG: thermonuclease family protein [Candidatus Eremiobacteraeota bacterium]|nr:thermonuclease family protein [Candidatus Eremiobacteraeota bacterium]
MRKTALCVLLFALLLTSWAGAQDFSTKVISITDGNDILVGEGTLKLNCIDCPDLDQPFGPQAKTYLEQLIQGKNVDVEVVWVDHSNRKVSKISLDGKDVGTAIASAGLAWYDGKLEQDSEIAQAADLAKAQKIGLWTQPNPVAPWDFRTQQRGIQPNTSGAPTGASNGSYGFNPLQNNGDAGTSWDTGTTVLSTEPVYGNYGYGYGTGASPYYNRTFCNYCNEYHRNNSSEACGAVRRR